MGYCNYPMNTLFLVLLVLLVCVWSHFVLCQSMDTTFVNLLYYYQISHSCVLLECYATWTWHYWECWMELKVRCHNWLYCKGQLTDGWLYIHRIWLCALINGIHFLFLGRSRIFSFDNAIVLQRSGWRSARVWHHQVRWCTVWPFLSFDSQFCDPTKWLRQNNIYRLSSLGLWILVTDLEHCCHWLWANVWIYFFCVTSECQHRFFIT